MKKIHTSAMLANLRISQWTARKIDKRVSGEVAHAHGVKEGVGSYYKSILSNQDINGEPTAIERIKKLVGVIRTYHYGVTLPWLDSGPRVLSSMAFFDYMQKMQEFRIAFDDAVNTFVYDYPFEREEAKLGLGSLFSDDDYPPVEAIRERFNFALDIMPIPMGADFRCDIGEDEAGRIREEIEKSTMATVQKSINDVYRRITAVVDSFVAKLQFEDTRFEKSLVTNAINLVELLPKLNFTGDPTLTTLATALREKLCVHSADVLRNDMVARRDTYAAALEVKQDLEAHFGSYQKGEQNGSVDDTVRWE